MHVGKGKLKNQTTRTQNAVQPHGSTVNHNEAAISVSHTVQVRARPSGPRHRSPTLSTKQRLFALIPPIPPPSEGPCAAHHCPAHQLCSTGTHAVHFSSFSQAHNALEAQSVVGDGLLLLLEQRAGLKALLYLNFWGYFQHADR